MSGLARSRYCRAYLFWHTRNDLLSWITITKTCVPNSSFNFRVYGVKASLNALGPPLILGMDRTELSREQKR